MYVRIGAAPHWKFSFFDSAGGGQREVVEIIRKSLQHSTRNWRIQPGTAVTMPAKKTNYGKTEPSMTTTGKQLNEEENKRVNIHIWAPSGMIEPYCQWFKPPYQKHVRNKLSVFIILRDREAKKTGNGIWICRSCHKNRLDIPKHELSTTGAQQCLRKKANSNVSDPLNPIRCGMLSVFTDQEIWSLLDL